MLSDQAWPVDLWSTFKRKAVDLTGVVVSGAGGATVQGPGSMTFFPAQSQIYTVSLASGGPATIANLITWTFPAIGGADLTVTGIRITAFPHRPDWTEPFRVRKSWLTEVFPGYDETEQRRSLRTRPRHNVTYRVLTTDPLETASLEALLYGWQARQFGVPIWPEATRLAADIAPGATSIVADTSLRPSFDVGGLVLLWSSFTTWEAFEVVGLAGGGVQLGSQATLPWAAGARVVPMRRGHIQPRQQLGRPANWLSAGAVSFDCEPV